MEVTGEDRRGEGRKRGEWRKIHSTIKIIRNKKEYILLIISLDSSCYDTLHELFGFGNSCSNLQRDNDLKAGSKAHPCW